MIHHGHNGTAFSLALAAVGTPIVGLWLRPVEWLVSILLSSVGSIVAVYIHEHPRLGFARLRREAAAEDARRRQRLVEWERRLAEREAQLQRRGQSPPAD